MRHALRLVAVTLATLASPLASPLRADDGTTRPVAATRPAGPITERDVVDRLIEFGDRFVVDAYRAGGRRDARWDADALAFLAAQVRGGHDDDGDPFDDLPDAVPQAQRLDLARRLLDGACDDAMVCYQAGRLFEATGDTTRAFRAFERAANTAEASGYASAFKLAIVQSAFNDFRRVDEPGRQSDARRLPRICGLAKATLADRSLLPKYRRQVWSTARDAFGYPDDAIVEPLGDAIGGMTDADPWLLHVAMAQIEIRRAWLARGGDTADNVTPAGWQGFARHLDAARNHCRLAIEVDDALPQPFGLMLTIAMGEDANPDVTRAWFANTIARQVDYRSAYSNYLRALLPRWGGTHVRMLQVGIDAVDTGRFDTSAPSQLLYAIEQIEQDMAGPLDARQRDRAYPHVVRCLDGYIAGNPAPAVQRWARSARAAWAARVGKWDEAEAQFAGLARQRLAVDAAAFGRFGIDVDEARERAALDGGPEARAVRAALATSPPAARAAALDAILARLPADDASRATIVARRESAAFADRLAGGAWTPLPLPRDLAGWRPISGAWRVDADGALVGQSTDGGGLTILAPDVLPARYEVRCELQHVADASGNGAMIAIVPGWGPRPGRPAVLVRRAAYVVDAALNEGTLRGTRSERQFAIGVPVDGRFAAHVRFDGTTIAALDRAGAPLASDDAAESTGRRLAFADLDAARVPMRWRIAKIEIRALP